MLTLPFATALAGAILSTSFLSGIFGTAGGMILMGILLLMMPFSAAMVLHGATQLTSNVWRAWLWRSHIQWRITGYFAMGAVNAALGFALVAAMPAKSVALIMRGLMPFVGLLLPRNVTPDITRPGHGFGCGILCTSLQLMAGVSGPVFDVYFIRSNLDRKQMVATKATIQSLGHFLKVAYFGQILASGTDTVAPTTIALAIALALIGTQLSRYVLDAISDAQFRIWTRRLITVIAAIYLIQGLFLLMLDLQHTAEAAAAVSNSAVN
jgi:uncharacterized membrane protein YfcA